ncbi:ferredoxin [Nocardia sp. NBC_00416]|uniref:ferredoxin n=1 Tax=Nocardia sp. NBC_00416 TaxID=2975991 RepID=UPI002E1F7EAA
MKVIVDEDSCKGHGICTTLCSEVFTLNDYGYAEAIADEIPEDLQEAVATAKDACPEWAIKIVDESAG